MAKRSAAAGPESRSRRGAGRLFSIYHRFLRLLSTTTPKTGRRTAKVARPSKPNSLRAADEEKHEHDVEARSPDAVAATVVSTSASAADEAKHEQDVEARSPDAATTAVSASASASAADEEKHEQDVEAGSPDAAAPAVSASASAADEAKHEQDIEAVSPDAAATAVSASEEAVAGKYWAHRYSLFNLYDRGVRMDAEGWYSTTPESIAASQAARAAPGDLVVDAFAGCGGNSIQFAARGCYVVAVEIDPRKVELAKHNARVYGVEDRIQFIVGDFFRVAPFLKADLVFLSPPWGGPSYIEASVYTLDMLQPKDGYATFQAAQKIAPNIMMFLPRTVDVNQVQELSWLSSPPLDFKSEENYVDHRFKGITAYFGGITEPTVKIGKSYAQKFFGVLRSGRD